jgi:hypothetical protein
MEKPFTTKKALDEIELQENRGATMIDSEHTLILFRPM